LLGIEPGEYARVQRVDRRENQLAIVRENGDHLIYDSRRLAGVAVFRETERSFSAGDPVPFTSPSREFHVANREFATIEKISRAGDLQVRLDSDREVGFNTLKHPHLDHGYAVTSQAARSRLPSVS